MSGSEIKKVAMLFAGGPAPAANAVIGTAAFSFLNAGIEVVGIKHGYSNLIDFDPNQPLVEGRDYINITQADLAQCRTSQGIIIGTARSNPGKGVSAVEHLTDPVKSAPLSRVYNALQSIGVDALISIGGDDTLKTANKMKLYQDTLPASAKRMPVVHLPKTIDNDYMGIDFTFGYFTAAEFLATEMRNLNYDAAAGRAYFVCEAMGRSAGWLAYGAAIAGEACMVLSVEDVVGEVRGEETITEADGTQNTRTIMHMEKIVDRIVKMMLIREKQDLPYGVLVIAEGLAEYLPHKYLAGIARDDHGHIAVASANIGKMLAEEVAKAYKAKTGRNRKVNGLQLGYESRCAQPHAFDVMLGSQIGVGAYRALIEEKLNGVMISVGGQFNLSFVPFETLVDPETLVTKVRYIEIGSDFHRLARFIETPVPD
ncbi:6-phosphofructokinase [Aureliella helgolandensis]|uniref:Pyrophosphate--fructose 6-phosphate 1-phosphotransferase n=1 Tax=Aureliella helgolandensis TaxID=2527968 RepID=A0A518G344_9BACT|nr:6-phosphofructokinase [Aureliella helgolandensis]QDV22959.1 Pyrophosphate--fructose 6-phosphate 1-phosphotransferase [Aureliella helgolandensis]